MSLFRFGCGRSKKLRHSTRTVFPNSSSMRRRRTAALPFCHFTLTGPKPLPASYPKALNTLGNHLRKRRLDLGLLQQDLAERLGVVRSTVRNWEANRSQPTPCFVPRIIAFLGYAPSAMLTPCEGLAETRKTLGLTRRQLAKRLGVDEDTLASWEAGRSRPRKKSLKIIETFLFSLAH